MAYACICHFFLQIFVVHYTGFESIPVTRVAGIFYLCDEKRLSVTKKRRFVRFESRIVRFESEMSKKSCNFARKIVQQTKNTLKNY